MPPKKTQEVQSREASAKSKNKKQKDDQIEPIPKGRGRSTRSLSKQQQQSKSKVKSVQKTPKKPIDSLYNTRSREQSNIKNQKDNSSSSSKKINIWNTNNTQKRTPLMESTNLKLQDKVRKNLSDAIKNQKQITNVDVQKQQTELQKNFAERIKEIKIEKQKLEKAKKNVKEQKQSKQQQSEIQTKNKKPQHVVEKDEDQTDDEVECEINILVEKDSFSSEDNNEVEISNETEEEKIIETSQKKRGRPFTKVPDNIKRTKSVSSLKPTKSSMKKENNNNKSKDNISVQPERMTRSKGKITIDDTIANKKQQKRKVKEDVKESKQEQKQKVEVKESKKRGRKSKVIEQESQDEQEEIEKSSDDEVLQTVKPKRGNQNKIKQSASSSSIANRRSIAEEKKQKRYEEQSNNRKASSDSDDNSSDNNNKQKQQPSPKKQTNIKKQGVFLKKPAKEIQISEKYHSRQFHNPIKNKYDDAIEMLQEYSLPEEIPCREKEKQEILDFINEGLSNNGCSSCLYISGVPGIGKTASFLEVIKKLQKEEEQEFTFIHINAMNLSNPENLYNILLKEITGISCSSKQKACQILTELFTRGKLSKRYEQYNKNIDHKNKVVLLDELDYLVTKDQDLLYNLMEWPHHKFAKLTVVGIANTMNLPEMMLNKIKSRMGSRRLVFNQYNNKQIQEIVETRLKIVKQVFEPQAIQYASNKIAFSSSDIRRTLKVLRKAVEICQKEADKKHRSSSTSKEDQNKEQLVTIDMIQKSYAELYSSPIIQAIKKLQYHHKLIILSIALENKHRGMPIAYFQQSYDRYKMMMSNLGNSSYLNYTQIKQMLSQLACLNLLSIKEKAIVKDAKNLTIDPNKQVYYHIMDLQITSNFTVDDITNSLRDDELYQKFQQQF